MPRPSLLLVFLTAGLAVVPASAPRAAEVTDVIDAADRDDPFDFVGQVKYSRTLRRAKITREYNCDPRPERPPGQGDATPQDRDTCPEAFNQIPGPGEAGELVHVKELRYERVIHTITPTARFGLWHDLELLIDMPIVVSDTQKVRFAGDGGKRSGVAVTPEISSIAPRREDGTDPEDLFDVPTEGLPTRAGFGDMLFMVRYAPISHERDDSRGDWVLEVGYRAPTGESMRGGLKGNEGVGRGVHELVLGTALSRRFRYLDPWVRFEAAFPFAADDSLFKDYGDSQEHIGPGARASFDFGSEIVPYENTRDGIKFFLDIGLGATYQAEGRDYSELFDALALGAERCDPSRDDPTRPNCGRYNPDSRSAIAGQPHDGITTVEEYVQLRGHLGAGVYISQYVRLATRLSLAHDTEHFIGAADIGRDLNSSGLVESSGEPACSSVRDSRCYDPREHNPTYVPAVDQVGRRLRVEETTIFGFDLSLAVLF